MLDDGDKKWVLDTLVDALNEVIGPRFDGVDRRLDGVEQRLDGVEHKLDGVEKRLDGVEMEIVDLSNDIVRVEKKLDVVTDHLAEKIDDHGQRLTKLEVAVSN